ncbi:hypothetical protein [Antrihabitans sp. YC2-6]|uniref:hypothetical protein n=1 Tax=Antrihabitans sp. YC2-6 TaxID=2799498 RepID=UPI0018F6223C|nr:hypothetical protein [Antrihabitans sp. YC2-6]MBJ8345550.1 hypothetical protein [Antrihabitans sp. YC2-6]
MATLALPQQVRVITTWHRPLLLMVAAMACLALVCATGIVVDDRTVLGESVWLKPLKFAFAFAVYGTTLAWLVSLPHRGSRWTWWLGTVFAVTGFVDVGFIAAQAARGTFSHFNTSTDTFNSVGQVIFTSGVPGLFLANLVIACILSWQKVADLPLTRAIHAGLALAVAGMALAYAMGGTGPQAVADASGRPVELAAGHSVGVADGGPGLPLTHWSTTGGDLRVPHFVGLHGIQVLLLSAVALAVLARRRPWLRDQRTRAALVGVLALAYAATLGVLTWQALRGQSVAHPDGLTLGLFGAILTGGALGARHVQISATARHLSPDRPDRP